MAVSTTAGTRMYVGPVVNVDTIGAMADDATRLAFFEAIASEDWTEIEEIESFGDLGDSSDITSFASVKDRRMRKFKTTRDAGTMTIVCGADPLDAGQIAMADAETTDDDYAFKVVYNDAPEADYAPSTDYFGGMVLTRPKNIAGVADITKRTFSLAVNTAVITDAAAAGSAPTNLVKPSVTGTAVQVGVLLTAVEGEWTGNPTSFVYAWQEDTAGNGTFAAVSPAVTTKTYTPIVGNIGNSLRVRVTAVNGAGSSSVQSSVGTTLVIAA